MRFCTAIANIFKDPDTYAETVSQGLLGERVDVLNADDHWIHIRTVRDAYTGFVLASALEESHRPGTHWVSERATPLFTSPDIKSPISQLAPFGAELSLHDTDAGANQFSRTDDNHYVWTQHVTPVGQFWNRSLGDTAQMLFSGCPYIWGGRSSNGLDCSAVVQLGAFANGISLPRDSADQQQFIESTIEYEERTQDDLVYWPGHVAILIDQHTVFHATAHTLNCCLEKLEQVELRAGAPTAVKRLDAPLIQN